MALSSLKGKMAKVLGCLTYMLEITVVMSPNVTPEKNGGDKGYGEDLDDPQIGLTKTTTQIHLMMQASQRLVCRTLFTSHCLK